MKIRCSECDTGHLVERVVNDHDVGPLVGLDQVVLVKGPGLICDHCGATTIPGEVLEEIMATLAGLIVEQGEELTPREVRYLRETLGLTQEELADRLGLKRLTIIRWENGEDAIGRIQSLALRSLVAWHLNKPDLARKVAELRPKTLKRTVPPYRLSA
jgi:putative zinc finger/helix-turn-helix YgiT family protein